jgi:hypothetical protein
VNIGGTISFNATNIYATITGSITGASTTPTLSPLNYSAKSAPTTTELNSWKQNLTFADATVPTVKWTIQIQNKSERALYVTLTDNIATLANATKTLTFDNGSATGEKTIPANITKTYTMEIKVTDTNASASVEYDFDFDLRDATAPKQSTPDDYPYFTFGYDESNLTASVETFDGSTTTPIFPETLFYNGKTYTVTTIKSSAFKGYEGELYITIPDNITTIESLTFSACTGLKSVKLGNGLTDLQNLVFQTSAIESIVIPDTVTYIGMSAFGGCQALKSVTIGANVSTMGQAAFMGCTSLEEVYVKATIPPMGSSGRVYNIFYDCPTTMKIYVPMESEEAYKSNGSGSNGWSQNADNIVGYNF